MRSPVLEVASTYLVVDAQVQERRDNRIQTMEAMIILEDD